MKFIKKINKGFTLLETITAIAILALTIVGPLSAIMSSSSYAHKTKDIIIANYLAEESVELLQNQYDSIYILCKKNPTDPFCTSATGETSGQISWRLFKERLGPIAGQPSCYLADNPNGCAFDDINMAGDITITPDKYIAGGAECPYLVEATSTIAGGVSSEIRHSYVCKGVAAHIPGTTSSKYFSRAISIEQLPASFTTGTMLNQDDLRITAVVSFKIQSGATSSIKIIRFMHAQP